jgi:hypothetical protein
MSSRSRARFVSVILAISVFLAGCTTTELPQGQDAVWHLVVIGDSTLWGVGEAFASQIEKDIGVQVVLEDFSLGGLSAGEVLEVLQTGETLSFQLQKLPTALRDAEVVIMFVNPVNSIDPEKPLKIMACLDVSQADTSCAPETFEKWTTDLKAIWAEILKIRKGKATILRALDIYNPVVIPWEEQGIYEACTECWINQSNAARLAAEAYNIPFLSRYDAFNGISHIEDPREKGYISNDGVHLSELGCQYTAELLSQMGYKPVSPP